MTDKEKARESWWNDDCCSGAMTTEKIYECGYLAGLKAGKPKWHKVADGDLPKRDERFLANISITVMTQENDFVCYSYDDKKWYSHGVEIGNVIAWCEIPKFEETSK